MIGLDTDILVRYLTQDDPTQSAKAIEILEKRLTENNPGFISVVVLVETIWVLDRAYGFVTQEISEAIEGMLQTDVLLVEHEQDVFTAMTAFKAGEGAFADILIGALGAKAGCSCTLTFDRKVARLPGFALG